MVSWKRMCLRAENVIYSRGYAGKWQTNPQARDVNAASSVDFQPILGFWKMLHKGLTVLFKIIKVCRHGKQSTLIDTQVTYV